MIPTPDDIARTQILVSALLRLGAAVLGFLALLAVLHLLSLIATVITSPGGGVTSSPVPGSSFMAAVVSIAFYAASAYAVWTLALAPKVAKHFVR